jgi:hypothetical protein
VSLIFLLSGILKSKDTLLSSALPAMLKENGLGIHPFEISTYCFILFLFYNQGQILLAVTFSSISSAHTCSQHSPTLGVHFIVFSLQLENSTFSGIVTLLEGLPHYICKY